MNPNTAVSARLRDKLRASVAASALAAASPPVRVPEASARYRLALEREAVARFGPDALIARNDVLVHSDEQRQKLDSSFRWDDEPMWGASGAAILQCRHPSESWDPAVAVALKSWIPAFAGMTSKRNKGTTIKPGFGSGSRARNVSGNTGCSLWSSQHSPVLGRSRTVQVRCANP